VNAPDEDGLYDLIWKADNRSEPIAHSAMFEPDLGNELTAVAFQPGAASRKLCARLPLALRDRVLSCAC